LYWFKWGDFLAQSAKWFNHSLRWLIYIVLLALVVVIIIYSSLAFLEKNQDYLEQQLSQAMHTTVRMEKFNATWHGFEPEIHMTGLHIYHPQYPSVVIMGIPHVKLELALWQSLLQWNVRLDGQVDGVNLNLVQDSSGQWAIEELLALGESRPEVRQTAANWLLAQAEWQLAQSNVVIHPSQKPAIQLHNLSLQNQNRGSRHQFRVQGLFNQQPFKLFADLQATGDIFQAQKWSGQVYAQLPVQSWHQWLTESVIADGQLITAEFGGDYWLTLGAGQVQQVTAQVLLPNLYIRHQQQDIELKQLTALLSWQHQAQQWQATLENLQGLINQQPVMLKQLTIQQGINPQSLLVGLQALDIGQVAPVLANINRLPTSLKTWLTQAKPTGKISQLWADIDSKPFRINKISAQLQQLSALATQKIIGCHQVDIWLNHQDKQGYAGVNIANGQLDLKPIYRQPTPIEQLQVAVKWTDLDDAWLIESNRLTLKNIDAQGEAVLSVWLPKQDMSAAQMQLLANITQGNLASVWRYVPWPSAGDDTLAWLKQALVSGVIERGDFLYEGVLLDSPKRPPSTMQMHFKVKKGTLAYAPEWPLLQGLNADVDIYNRQLTVKAKNSQIYQSIARDIAAEISDLNEPKLRLKADLDTTGEDVMRLFKETPLKQETAHFADMVGIKGGIAGQLELQLPLSLRSAEALQVDVLAELVGNPVILQQAPEFDLWLSGGISYKTGLGLSSLPLEGFLLAQPVSVKLQSVLNAGDIEAVQISANGQLAPINLKPWLGDLTQSMSGLSRYQTLLTVPMSDAPVHIIFDSNTVGWKIDLPEPFKKQADKPLAIHYEMELQSPTKQTGYLMVGAALQSGFEVENAVIKRMMVQLGENWTGTLPPEGLWVRGQLSEMNVDEWLPWLRPIHNNKAPQHVASVMPALQSFNVGFDNMSYLGYQLHNVRVGYEPLDDASRFQITSSDLNGELIWPFDAHKKVKLNLQSLKFPFDNQQNGQAAKVIKPNEDWLIPSVDIKVKELTLKTWPQMPASQLSAQLIPSNNGVNLTNITLSNPHFNAKGMLDWQWQGKESTRYNGQINVANVANLFEAFNRPAALSSQQAQAEFALYWQGNPTDLSLDKINGELSVDLKKGRVLQLNRALNLSRILGVLDSDNFKKRLKFDFSDITQKGLAYDEILFEANVHQGSMDNSLVFKSPSLQAQAQGVVNLSKNTIDEVLQVSVPMVSVVPYAAAFVAGPAVGGALVAAEAMLDNPITQMTTLHYDIKGSLAEPKVERIKNPDLLWRKWLKKKPKLKP